MIKIENYEVVGWEHAVRGMRNPMNSWAKSDSDFKGAAVTHILENDKPKEQHVYFDALSIGPNDHDLMMRLAKGGSVHAKYRRMITVYVDITAPLYWWKEFDTYKVGTVANSCSTMHKLTEKEFTIDDFSCEHLYIENTLILEEIVKQLNVYRYAYIHGVDETDSYSGEHINIDPNDKGVWWQMIQLLPSSYNQKRTVMLNYEVLTNIYNSRRNHKLDEWEDLCDWIETLPYSEIIIGDVNDE